MTGGSTLERGRQAFERQAWRAAYELLCAADEQAPLGAEDLERAGRAAYLIGRDDDSLSLCERAFRERLRQGDPEGAALDGFWLVFGLITRGDWARAGGWVGRARAVIDDGRRDCAARGYLLGPDAVQALLGGDPQRAYAGFSEQREIGRRFADHDLLALAGFGQGQALIAMGRIPEGIAVLDEVMVGVTAGETSPMVAGLVYCGVIAACMETFDPRRAKEWTVALKHWCDAQPDLVQFRGQCMVHRAQIMQIEGAWLDALEELRQASERFTGAGHPAAGDALYEQAELHRWRGDTDDAEQAYRRAATFGRDPQPGLALLRLAQGQLEAASAGVRRALEETTERVRRPRLLSAAVEIALEGKDVHAARAAADELARLAAERDVPVLQAMAAHAGGLLGLAEGDAARALAGARRAWSMWQQLDAPYEAARARVVVALACRALGDEDGPHGAGRGPAGVRAPLGRTRPGPGRGPDRRGPDPGRVRADGAGGRGAPAGGDGPDQPGDRRRAVPQREDGGPAPQQHLHQARGVLAVRGHRLGVPSRPRLSSWADLPMRPVGGMRALPDVRAGAAA